MPDITMCKATDCDLSDRCYRHQNSGTKPDEFRQAYWLRGPDSPTGSECKMFWERTAKVAAAHDGTF